MVDKHRLTIYYEDISSVIEYERRMLMADLKFEKEKNELKELIELLIPLSKEGKEAAKNVLIGMNLNEQANKIRQTA